MKTIILCGGKGTRLREETEFKPKPMVKIGEMPILVHIMRQYAYYGFNEFVLCLGYKSEMIKEYFLNQKRMANDFELDLKTGEIRYLNHYIDFDFKITFVETGEDTQSGERVKIASQYIKDEEFMVTYGDGVSNINLKKLLKFHRDQHREHGTLGTISAVHPSSKYGKIYARINNVLHKFNEKPVLDDYINGGFMVMNRKALTFIRKGEMLEDSLQKMTKKGKLSQFRHNSFWHSMDTMKDVLDLNKMWEEKVRPWAIWEKRKK